MKSPLFYLSYLLRKLWTLSAIVLVTLAVLLSVLRYALPQMDNKKHWLEDYISQEYGADLKIGSISADWKGFGPAIVLRNVSLNNQSDSPIQLNIEETQIELDFWASLVSRKVHSQRFNLNGLTLSLDIPRLEAAGSDYPVVDALRELFLEQLQRFSVNDSDLFLATDKERQHIQIQQLSWLNQDLRHQGVGMMRVEELASNSARFILDLRGGSENLQGIFYADARDLDISPWLQEFNPSQRQVASARLNFTFWADIRDSYPVAVQANLSDSQFSWLGKPEQTLALQGGIFTARPAKQGWNFALQDLQLLTNNKDKLHLSLIGNHRNDGVTLRSANLNVNELLPALAPFMEDEDFSRLQAMAPHADLSELAFYMDPRQFAATLSFTQLTLAETRHVPGVTALQGRLDWYDDQASIEVSGLGGELQTDSLLGHVLPYDSLYGRLYLRRDEQDLTVTLPRLEFVSETLSFIQAMEYRQADDFLSLATQIKPMQVQQAKRLFSADLMGEQTKRYLDRALIEGDITSAALLWYGQPAAFPFGKGQGIFQAAVTVNDSEFSFDADWPSLTELDMQLLFENEGLWMQSSQGKLRQLSVGQVNAVIPSLTEGATLSIDIQAQASGPAVTDLMLNSELAGSVGAALTQLQVKDNLDADVNLSIPLSGENVVASGKVRFRGNPVHIPSLNLDVASLHGQLSFRNDQISASDLQGQIFGQPLTIDLKGQQRDDYETRIQLRGQWDLSALLASKLPAMQDYLTGQAPWQADLDLILPEEGYRYEFALTSSMEPIVSTLPPPFAKPAGRSLPLHLDVSGDSQVSNVRMQLGNGARFNGLLPHQEMRFSRAHLALGESSFAGMGNGFSVSANLPTIRVEAWHQVLGDLLGEIPTGQGSLLPAPERIFVSTDKLELLGLTLDKAEVQVKHSDLAWLASINSEQSRAELELAHDWLGRGIRINADYLNLPEWQDQDLQQKPDLSDLPPVILECKRCRYQQYDLGRVSLKLDRASHGMHIDRLDIQRTGSRLSATGDWYIGADSNSTRMRGRFESDDFGDLLRDFEFDAGVRDSAARMDFDLSWQQAPYQFNFASLNGDVDWRLSDGYLTEVSDKGARLFSILSLESLVRKLTLDFRDVFAKGFFYDEMQGTFQIADGRVHTQDTSIDGAAGKMLLAGYTDLNNKTLNYKIGFTPKVTSSLPVILAWMVNPATAIAAYALDEVLTSAKVISNIEYSLSGTLDSPVLEELGRDSREVQLPAKVQPPVNTQPDAAIQYEDKEQSNG
ncbi:YhdP family protein [Bowmanella dokdonensis]|uniref:TIGR02099 family protein n=1 Tax=Bowmanella dokdonensis TaxID=751969 RepID=A0A939DPX7_9ALTE|nr:YhdP family protein [Bowmanella dokdonensis]MBN7826075.1 TIGR02099 family protein [Bowmanella dokdonensis]